MIYIDERAVKHHTHGNMLVQEHKYNEAITQFLKAIEISPRYDAAVYHLAEAYEAKQLDDDAYKYYMKAIELNNSYATIHIEAGLDSLLSGPLGKAVAEFKKNAGAPGHDGGQAEAPAAQPATRLSEQSVGEPHAPQAKKGLAPKKFTVEAAGNLESEVETCDTVRARVFGERDLPVQGAQVTFSIVLEDKRLADSMLAPSREKIFSEPRQKVTIPTDETGTAVIFFKRSKFTGKNILSVSVPGLPDQLIDDITVPAAVADISIEPQRKIFIAGAEVTYTAKAKDRFGNPSALSELHFYLHQKDVADWFVADAAVHSADGGGVTKRTIKLPTKSGSKCKLQVVNKESGVSRELEFTLVSGKIGSALFIPMKGKVEGGKPFALKLKLLDEFDNAVIGKKATIVIDKSHGGDWEIGKQDSEVTGDDGSVFLLVTPPEEVGATAVFTVQTDGLEEGKIATASFETVPAGKADTVHTAAKSTSDMAPKSAPAARVIELPVDDADLDLIPTPGAVGPAPARPAAPAPKGHGLETLDFDQADSSFSAGAEGASLTPPASAGSVPAPPAGKSGSTLDALGSMLDDDVWGGPVSAAPATAQKVDAPPAPTISGIADIVLEKNNLTCQVGDSVQLAISAMDKNGDPITKGLVALFRIVEEPGEDKDACFVTPDGTPTGEKNYKAQSDGSTQLTATVQASTTSGQIEVAIRCGGKSVNALIEVAIGTPDKITLAASEQRLPPGNSAVITARIVDKFGNPIKGEKLTFGVKESFGKGGDFEEPILVTTNNSGEATAMYVSGGNPGDRTIVGVSHPTVLDSSIKFITIETLEPPKDTGGSQAPSTPPQPAFAPLQPGVRPPVANQQQTAQRPAPAMAGVPFNPPAAQQPAFTPPAAPFQPSAPPPQQFRPPAQPAPQFQQPAFQPVAQGPQTPQPGGPQGGFQQPAFRPPQPPQPSQGFQPPARPPQGQGVEYLTDELPIPAANPQAPGGQPYGAGYSEDNMAGASTEELMEMLDPYAAPKFSIKRGKKPVMELSELMPKILLLGLGALALLAIMVFGFRFTKDIRYSLSLNKADDFYSQNNTEEARKYYEKCIELDAEKPKPYVKLGEIYLSAAEKAEGASDMPRKERMANQAVSMLDKAVSITPNDADSLYDLGKAYKFVGNCAKARDVLKRTLKADPKYSPATSLMKDIDDMARIGGCK